MTNPWDAFDLSPAAVELWRLESTCRRLWAYEPLFVPGLLQTPEYTRALLEAISVPPLPSDRVGGLIAARTARQALLSRPNRPDLRFVVEEAVLTRLVGSQAVMLAQLDRIEEAAASGINVQVIPAGSPAHPGMSGAFWVLDGQVFREGLPGVAPDYFGPAWDVLEAVERITAVAVPASDLGGVLDRIRADFR